MTSIGGLSAPDALACTLRCGAGPFARARATLPLPPPRFSLTNSGDATRRIVRVGCDPPRGEGGQDCSGRLWIEFADAIVQSGESIALTVQGRIAERPGTYRTTVRIVADTGETLEIPLSITVAASPLWGLLLLLLGLATVATLNVLAKQSAADDAQASITRFRQRLHERLDQAPPPLSQAPEVVRLDRDLDDALAALRRRRPWSFRDTRVTEALGDLDQAKARWTQIQAATGRGAPGAAQIAELQAAWSAFGNSLDEATRAAVPPAAPALAGALAGFLDRLRHRVLIEPARVAQAQLAPRVERARLLALAGGDDAGRRAALTAQRALMRAADFVEARVALVQRYAALVGGMVASDQIARALVADLPTDARAAVEQALDRAGATLGDAASLNDLQAANAAIEAARTQALRLAADAMLARMNARVAAEARVLNTDAVDQVWASLAETPHPTPEQKRAGLRRVLDAWFGIIAGLPDEAARKSLMADVASVAEALKAPDLAAISGPYRALVEAWADYVKQRRLTAARDTALPFCRSVLAGVTQDQSVLDRMLASFPAGSEQDGWDRQADRISRAATQAPYDDPNPGACISYATTLDGEQATLSGAMFRAALRDTPIPFDLRLDAAQRSGDAQAEALIRSLIRAPRSLRIHVRTAPEDWTAQRAISFGVEGVDPLWGSSVQITLDWGDGTPPFRTDADSIRRGAVPEHAFARPVAETLHVVAQDPTAGQVLGEGRLTLPVGDSPVSLAQGLAERLFNMRFLLALAVAVMIYLWRFQAGRKVFGASSVDYVEAFALGIAMDAIVADLPVLLSRTFGG